MQASKEELDIEKAIEDTKKLMVLGSAMKAGIFKALVVEKNIASLAQEIGGDERALYIIIEALCAIGYVNKKKDRYIISKKARPLFLEPGEDYIGGYLPHFLNIMSSWLKLPEIIREGKPGRDTSKRDIAAFMHAMASRAEESVASTVDLCLGKKKEARRVLDLGGGPGVYSRVFADRGLDVVLYDMPEIIEYVSTEFKLSEIKNLLLIKGDFTEAEFEKDINGSFDIIFMANICHIYSEKENMELIKRAGTILNKNGMIAIEDFVRGRSPVAEIFAVNMLANTQGGGTWSEEQYRKWLLDGGLNDIEVVDMDGKERQLIMGFKH